jgi:hypothetical protein
MPPRGPRFFFLLGSVGTLDFLVPIKFPMGSQHVPQVPIMFLVVPHFILYPLPQVLLF